jgi:hypothetical protein
LLDEIPDGYAVFRIRDTWFAGYVVYDRDRKPYRFHALEARSDDPFGSSREAAHAFPSEATARSACREHHATASQQTRQTRQTRQTPRANTEP